MSDDKKTLIDLVPDSVDNAVKNITDKPTQNMGTTLADIWYLVFGGISQAAQKRKLKYSYALQEFENELKEKIDKIPKDRLVEPDIQVVAPALEDSKYCVERKELRNMFTNLISSAMNSDYTKYVHPTYTNILKQLSHVDAIILEIIYHNKNKTITLDFTKMEMLSSLSYLESQGLIYTDIKDTRFQYIQFEMLDDDQYISNKKQMMKLQSVEHNQLISVEITKFGESLCKICLD